MLISLRVFVRLLVVGCFVVLSSAVAAASSSLRSLKNAQFEIVGLDQRSVSYVEELSRFAVERSARYLGRDGLGFPTPVLVSLRPEEYYSFEGQYRLEIRERGTIELLLKWDTSLELEVACRAIAEALITQYAIFNYGPKAPENIRAWTATALAADVYFALRPGKYVGLANQTREVPLPSLSPILDARMGDEQAHSAFGYWFLKALKSSFSDRSVSRSFFQEAVGGLDVEEMLLPAVEKLASEPVDDGEELSAPSVSEWWQAEVRNLVTREFEVVESMAISRGWLAELARFDAPIVAEEKEMSLTLRSLWANRGEPAVKDLIQARYEILKVRINRVNPAYFNAAQSLGSLYEALLSDGPSHKYIHSLAIYLSDWEDAKKMQHKIEETL